MGLYTQRVSNQDCTHKHHCVLALMHRDWIQVRDLLYAPYGSLGRYAGEVKTIVKSDPHSRNQLGLQTLGIVLVQKSLADCVSFALLNQDRQPPD